MKLVIFLVLSIALMANGLPSPNPEVQKTTLCVYFDNTKQILCQHSEIQIQCDAFVVGQNQSIRFLGISQQSIDNTNPELVKYFVYPRKENSSTYFGYSASVEGKSVEYVLYYGEQSDQPGLRILNLSCWKKLLDVLKGTEQTQLVKLTDSQEKVSLIGEILIDINFKRSAISKRYYNPCYYGGFYGYYVGWYCGK
ncbi:unnamed protein product [Brachionus calyciflorus]|uniref:Uncharacterized protein n=1 Tax=Brachionus calyciflorus TaxID=104777 RepID=A0A814F5P0_9BILA|nr:unnamed protein product [Brachionus calyciflorus]